MRRLPLSALVFISLAAVSLTVLPQEYYPYRTLQEANIRDDSTTFAPIIAKLEKNQIVEVKKQKYQWYQLILPKNSSCWVWADFIDQRKNLVTASSLHLRSRPCREARILALLKKNQAVRIKSQQGDWLEISCYPYGRGWVHENFLERLNQDESFAYFIEKKLPDLNSSDPEKQKRIETKISKNPVAALGVIDNQLSYLSPQVIYRLIALFSRIAKNDSQLKALLFTKINPSSLLNSAVYLDIVQNTAFSNAAKIPFYYLFQQKKISPVIISGGKKYLAEKQKNN